MEKMQEKTYLCIDLKSFYASVECIERGLDPMKTNLVVADSSRTEKTICLAVTPSLKQYGLSGRSRLFEVVKRVSQVNGERLRRAPNRTFSGESHQSDFLEKDSSLKLTYLVAPPRMAHYMEYSTRIYDVYLKYVSPDDILVYSIDEVFIDLTAYLSYYKKTARELALTIIRDVLATTGITATAGIGTNLYLAKIAMDIKAKKMPADKDGVRIAFLDEQSYRQELWNHMPLTDFWRVGEGSAKRLAGKQMYTMGDIAKASVSPFGRQVLKKLFGINAKLLIDHAWGYEPCSIAEAKAYIPENRSLNSGQVLSVPYDYEKTRLIVREMTELMALDLVEKRLLTDQMTLTLGYDTENVTKNYRGKIETDRYGRKTPKSAHGTVNLSEMTSSTTLMMEGMMELFQRIADPKLTVRRVTITVNHLVLEKEYQKEPSYEQLNLFTDSSEKQKREAQLQKERSLQETTVKLRNRFGKNAVLKGTNLQEGATTIDRNRQIGGHKA